MSDSSKPYHEMSPTQKASYDAALTTKYQRDVRMSGYRSTIAKNERDEAVYSKEALEARMQVFGLHRQLGELAIREGVDMTAAKARSEKAAEQATEQAVHNITYPDTLDEAARQSDAATDTATDSTTKA